MKKSKLYVGVISLAIIFCFGGFAYAGGGGPQDPLVCGDPPDPTSGPFIWGSFTVSQIPASGLGGAGDRSVVHMTFRRWGEVHLFQFLAVQKLLCGLDGEIILAPEEEGGLGWGDAACQLDVGSAFGLDGYPVIKRLKVRQEEMCGTNGEMIRGTMLIRVVPLTP